MSPIRSNPFHAKRLTKALVALTLLLSACAAPTSTPAPQPTLDTSGFARALAPIEFAFPRDHGPHFDFQTEWWYYTGNLDTADGRHFGYQLTFFRRGLTPGAPPQRPSDFGTNQIYFAHFALTDVKAGEYTFAERFSRGAAKLAGASGEPYQVWLEDWSVESLNAEGSVVSLRAREGKREFALTLRAAKPIVAHGDRGLSQKSEAPGNASYYVSFTRMDTEGQVTVNGQTAQVTGESWFDHEWSTSALGAGIIGWNWFSLQLGDGREVMFYQFRQADGSIGRLSAGTLIEKDGSLKKLAVSDIQIEARGQWLSPATKGAYPDEWRLTIPSAQIELNIVPWLAGQEMRASFPYWEGAVKFTGTSNGAAVTGNGYIELTGYVSSMQGVF
jgi:predicted secreted hydrolase